VKSSEEEKKEFELLVKANMKRAYYAALGILGSSDAAMELSQAAFVKAFRNFSKFDRNRDFFAWYFTILKNLCLNYIRDNKKNVSLEEIIELKENEENYDPVKLAETEELKVIIQKALFNLHEEDREILILREFQNYSYKEIARLLEIPEGTVMSRLYYARKKLAEEFKKHYE